MSLALCLRVVSQAPQHFRSSEKQATCEGCFARQSICLVISLHSSMSGQNTKLSHVLHTGVASHCISLLLCLLVVELNLNLEGWDVSGLRQMI